MQQLHHRSPRQIVISSAVCTAPHDHPRAVEGGREGLCTDWSKEARTALERQLAPTAPVTWAEHDAAPTPPPQRLAPGAVYVEVADAVVEAEDSARVYVWVSDGTACLGAQYDLRVSMRPPTARVLGRSRSSRDCDPPG